MADELFPDETDWNVDTSDDYKVGYARPPKNTQFQKGVSGNPKGRPKRPRSFGYDLLREAGSLVTINEHGQPQRITKHEVALKQLMNHAMKGSIQAIRTYINHYVPAREAELAANPTLDDSKKYRAENLSDDDLARIIMEGQKERNKCLKSNVSNAE